MKNRVLIEQILSVAVLLIMLIYTSTDLFVEPYIGFHFDFFDGSITHIFTTVDGSNQLQIGDKIESIGGVKLKSFRSDLNQSFFEGAGPGNVVEIEVTRDSQRELINWILPEWTTIEFIERLSNVWWLAYIFWLAGLVTVLLIRPVDLRQQLLVSFFYLTALWIGLGAAGRDHRWYSTVLSRSLILLTVPVYLHLHWMFPRPLRQMRTVYWIPLYVIAFALAVAQLFQLLSPNIFTLGILVAMGGSIFLLALHLIIKREQRRDIAIMFVLALFAFLPTIIISSVRLTGTAPLILILGLLTLAGLPGAYFYVAYRQQSGWLEFRSNRLVGIYLFLILLFVINVSTISLISRAGQEDLPLPIIMLLMTGVILIAIIGYSPFQRRVDKHLLGMPLEREHLVETYTTRITSSLTRDNLTNLLRDELMPSLHIRQSALVQQGNEEKAAIIYADGVALSQIPDWSKIIKFTEDSNRSQPLLSERLSWVHLAIPLKLDGQLNGVWLFGRHDPDDIYSHEDIRLLQQLAQQTAIALANINQRELLQNLYATNIQRQEEERTNLARTLHDDVLNDLAVLSMQHHSDGHQFTSTYEGLVSRIRLMVHGLRPVMLDYGLWRALDDLLDGLQDRAPADTVLRLDIPKSGARYPVEVEQHMFRIMQQALENALEHAQADVVTIEGQFSQSGVAITIEDDGIGLLDAQNLGFSALLAKKHYGLVGMFERSELIGAQLNIRSAINKFTRISLEWQPAQETSNARIVT